jgi:hypothetical protein
MSFIKLRLRYKVELILFAAVCLCWIGCGLAVAGDIQSGGSHSSVNVDLGFLASGMGIIWWGARSYQHILDEQKATNKLIELQTAVMVEHTKVLNVLTQGMTAASGLAAVAADRAELAVTEAKTAAEESKKARDHTDEQISRLDCQKSKRKKCKNESD